MPPLRRSPRTHPSSSTTLRRSPKLPLVLYHAPLQSEPQPQPLKIYKPHLLKLHATCHSPTKPRRSPRLLGASIGLANGDCGPQLLLLLPEKEACKLARECLDDHDLTLKRLRSRTFRTTTPPPLLHRKRMRHSGDTPPGKKLPTFSEDTPPDKKSQKFSADTQAEKKSPRFSGEVQAVEKSPRFSGEMQAVEKSQRFSGETLAHRGLPRRSGRFTGHNSDDTPPDWKSPRFSEDTPANRKSPRFSGETPAARKSPRFSDEAPANRKSPKIPVETQANRKSTRFSGETPADGKSPAFSNGTDDRPLLALPCPKRSNLDCRRNSDGNLEQGFPRRSGRLSGEKPLPVRKSISDANGKLVRKYQERSSREEKSENIRKVCPRKTVGVTEEMPENVGFRRRSSRVSGGKAVQHSSGKELTNKDEGKEEKETKDDVLDLSIVEVEPSPCSELVNTPERSEDPAFQLRVSAVMEEIFGTVEEEKVVRRSPRGLSSICLVDDYQCDEMKGLTMPGSKKKKKGQEKVAKGTKEKSKASESLHTCMDGEGKIEEELGGTGREIETEGKSCFFVGEAVPEEEARQKWGWRYQLKNRRSKGRSLTANADDEDEPILQVKYHYTGAQINGCTFHLGDCALIRGEEGQEHVGRILEFFQSMEGDDYFRVQWFYKAEDTVMKGEASFHDKKRVFYSTIMNDNMLDCIISKLNVAHVTPELILKTGSVPPSDFYYDMEYCLDCSTFRNLPRDISVNGSELSSISCPEPVLSITADHLSDNTSIYGQCNAELAMLDVYAGCGAMSTGLCIGAKLSGINLVTRWAIDADSLACESLRLNHPETHVKNEAAEDFLELLKHWEKLCNKFVTGDNFPSPVEASSDQTEMELDEESSSDISDEELEVSSLVDICYGDTDESGKRGIKFKVRWKGYDPSEDTWEPIEGLSNCQELIQDFVLNGFKNKILPLPGDVDVICGGPPCQGISGYNRFRCVDDPLSDEKNRQLIVFMDIVEFLKPKFVLMENVTDILRLNKGSLGRYALSRLVNMNYQARVGIMAAGCYGLPQFRLRVFFWGALHSEELPQFPLPTHDVVVRYWPPPEFERNVVAYNEGQQPPELEDTVLLNDAISDLPSVTNYESSDEMPYNKPPETKFQKYIRSTNREMIGSNTKEEEAILYDHRPHQLFEDDYIRVCQIPRRKGANFRDLPGIIVGDDNVVRRDPDTKPLLLPSGRPMVPEYVFTFEQGKSRRPFGRLWWEETMATVVTYPNCHSQVVLHPEQDRLLTVRECARLQGFPDNYRFCGTVKKRYRQVGNAVAIPVAKALGYALGMASQRLLGKEPLITLPPNFTCS